MRNFQYSNESKMKIFAVFLFVSVTAAQNNGGGWNPFTDKFDFSAIRGAPSGLGHFPTFNGFNTNSFPSFSSGFGGSGVNQGGASSGGASPAAAPPPRSGGGSGGSGNGRNRQGGGGNNGFSWNFPSFTPVDFSSSFADFQKQFATQFPWSVNGDSRDNSNANTGSNNNVDSSSSNFEVGDNADTTTVTARRTFSTKTSNRRTPITSTTTSATTSQVNDNNIAPITNVNGGGASLTVTSRNCTQEGLVVGISPSSSDPCGSVECECFKGIYFCYSTCSAPAADQTCDAVVPAGGSDLCPQYSNCGPLVNKTEGTAHVFRCDPRAGSVHPSVCWMYEILFGKLTEPLGFFESVADECPLATHCICAPDGFIRPAQFRQEDFQTPANNRVYTRSVQGRKGAFATP